jgi:hypothetical protein
MQLELNDEEHEALRTLLDSSLADLKGEIHDTDNVTFRKGLAHYRAMLQSISSRLAG